MTTHRLLMPTDKVYYIGIMTGTSMDAVDAVLVSKADFKQSIAHHSEDFPNPLKADLQALIDNPTTELATLGTLQVRLAKWYAQVVKRLMTKSEIVASQVIAVGCHGQTVFHQPDGANAFSMQLVSGAHLAQFCECTVVCDFRNQDMAAGGQGAPLASAYHQQIFSHQDQNIMVLNLGGIANCTYLPALNTNSANQVIGFDTGPANTLMDSWIQRHLNQAYDTSGQWAQTGQVQEPLLATLLADDYFGMAFPKSTGREYFNLPWLEQKLSSMTSQYAAEDVQATLLALTCHSIAIACKDFEIDQLIVCGGGVNNTFLIEQLDSLINCPIKTAQDYGIDPQRIEALAFAWLANQCVEAKPGTIASVTGAKHQTITGALYQFLSA